MHNSEQTQEHLAASEAEARTKFEAWASEQYFLETHSMCDEEGAAWDAWQAATALLAAECWQPIETAPKDGSHVHLYAPELQFVGFYAEASGWCYVAPCCPLAPTQPTHWMPLSAPPTRKEPMEWQQSCAG